MKSHLTSRSVVVPAVYAFIFDDEGHFLVGRRQNTGYRDGKLTVPSGHIEEYERPLIALCREVNEEVGIRFSEKDWKYDFTLYRKSESGEERVDFFFSTHLGDRHPVNNEPEKCSELIWLDPAHLPSDLFDYITFVSEQIASGRTFGVFGY